MNCAEKQTQICKAFIAECYGNLLVEISNCTEPAILKQNIATMLDKVKILIENNSVEKAD